MHLIFWNIVTSSIECHIKGYGINKSSSMIVLQNDNIALSTNSKEEGFPIVIIDSSVYQIVTVIQLTGDITHNSSLCMFNQDSFIYASFTTFLQISCDDYSIIFKTKGGKFNGTNGIILIKGGKYLAIHNNKCISIVKPYDD